MPDQDTVSPEQLLRMTTEVAAAYLGSNTLPSSQIGDKLATAIDLAGAELRRAVVLLLQHQKHTRTQTFTPRSLPACSAPVNFPG